MASMKGLVMKTVSRGLALEVSARFGTQVNWDELDAEGLHENVAKLSPEEFGRRFTAFLKAGARFSFGGLKVATAPFNPAECIGSGWSFWKGDPKGNGKDGDETRDKASLALTEVDFEKPDFLTCLNDGESRILGEEKLVRLRALNRTIYGTTVGWGLWLDYQQNGAQCVLEKLYQQKGIEYVDFFGDVLRGPSGYRYVLDLARRDDGSWGWFCGWLGSDWRAMDFTAVSQQVSSL